MAKHTEANWTAKVYWKPGKGPQRLTRKNAPQLLVAIAVQDLTPPNSNPFDVTADVPDWHLMKAYQLGKVVQQQSYRNKPGFFYSLVDLSKNSPFSKRDLLLESTGVSGKQQAIEQTLGSGKTEAAAEVAASTANTPDAGNASVLNLVTTQTTADAFSSVGLSTHGETLNYIHHSYSKKPAALIMNEVHWKYLVRSVIRGRNVLMTGPSGTGKTLSAMSVAKAVNREFFYFNLGATQDPRSSLIGNTHLNKETGTYFAESPFIKAIRTPNAIILLDEISRAHPDAWNILMTVLDLNQRYLRLDEKEDSELVKVADGVSFVATANIGAEYTSTRVMDKALYERFGAVIEMPYLTMEEEEFLLAMLFPSVNHTLLSNLAEIADTTRRQFLSGDGKLTNCISTRVTVEAAGLLYDNFTLAEAAEAAIYPHFSLDGGIDSERTFVKQIVQRFVVDTNNAIPDNNAWFGPDDMNGAV